MENNRLKKSDLILLGFEMKSYQKRGYDVFFGHRIEVRWSEKSIAIKPISCSCILVQKPSITVAELESFLKFLK